MPADPLNLDKVIADRTGQDPFLFEYGGDVYEIPLPLDAQAMFLGMSGDVRAALDELLDDQAEAFWANRPDMDLVELLFDELGKAAGYGPTSPSSPGGTSKRTKTT